MDGRVKSMASKVKLSHKRQISLDSGRIRDLPGQRDFQKFEIAAAVGHRMRHAAWNGDAVVRRQNVRAAKLPEEAAALVSNDFALIPRYFQVSAWAVRKEIVHSRRGDERTYAFGFRPG